MTKRAATGAPFATLPSSGSTSADVVFATGSLPSSATALVVPAVEEHAPQQRGRPGVFMSSWHAAIKAFTVVALPLGEVYDLPRRRNLSTGDSYVIVIEDYITGDEEPESIFALHAERPTLWLPTVPILPRRRPFIPPWDPSEDE